MQFSEADGALKLFATRDISEGSPILRSSGPMTMEQMIGTLAVTKPNLPEDSFPQAKHIMEVGGDPKHVSQVLT